MANEELGEIFGRIHAGFRRTLRSGVLLADPAMRELHLRLMALEPTRLMQQSLAATRFVVMDTETTGMRAYAGDEICSIALIEIEGMQITGRQFSTLINPGRDIPAASTRYHNITNEAVRDAPVIEEILIEAAEFLGDSIIVGHHIGFDIRFINKILQRELFCRLRNPFLDTMLLYQAVSGRVGQYSLESVAAFADVPITDRHTALGDARATAEIFVKLAGQLGRADQLVREMIDRQFEPRRR